MKRARPKVGIPTKDFRACNKAIACEKRMREKEDMMEKIRGTTEQGQLLVKGASGNLFQKKYNNYITEKEKKIKQQKEEKKPIFKFYHVDNTFGFNFYNAPFLQNVPIKFGNKVRHLDHKNSKNIKPKDLYSHIPARVDTGLKRLKKTKPSEPITAAVVDVSSDNLSQPSLMTRVTNNRGSKKGCRELVNIIQSSLHTSYNLRQTPARLSTLEKKSENVKTPKTAKQKKAGQSSSNLTPHLNKLSLSHHSTLHANTGQNDTLDIHNQSHQNLGEYPHDGNEEEQVHWFERLYECELKFMETLSGTWSDYMDNQMGMKSKLREEVIDDIRTAVGILNLFKCGRFKQFGDLIEACQYKTGAKITKPMDLMGFWEMIQNQVEEIRAKFIALDGRRADDWPKLKTPKTKTPKKRMTKKKVGEKGDDPGSEIKSSKAIKLESNGRVARLNIAELKAKFKQNTALLNTEPVDTLVGSIKHELVCPEDFEAKDSDKICAETHKENVFPVETYNNLSAMQRNDGTPNVRRSQRLKGPLQNLSLNESMLSSPSGAKLIGTPLNVDNPSNRRNTLAKLATYFPEMSPIQSALISSPMPKASKRDRVSFGISSHVQTEDEKLWPEDSTINKSRRSLRRASRLVNSHFLPPIPEISSPTNEF